MPLLAPEADDVAHPEPIALPVGTPSVPVGVAAIEAVPPPPLLPLGASGDPVADTGAVREAELQAETLRVAAAREGVADTHADAPLLSLARKEGAVDAEGLEEGVAAMLGVVTEECVAPPAPVFVACEVRDREADAVAEDERVEEGEVVDDLVACVQDVLDGVAVGQAEVVRVTRPLLKGMAVAVANATVGVAEADPPTEVDPAAVAEGSGD